MDHALVARRRKRADAEPPETSPLLRGASNRAMSRMLMRQAHMTFTFDEEAAWSKEKDILAAMIIDRVEIDRPKAFSAPTQHIAGVAYKLEQGTARPAKGNDLRHEVAWQTLLKYVRKLLSGLTLRQADDLLDNMGHAAKTKPVSQADIMVRVEDLAAALYDMPANLWYGPSAANQAMGSAFPHLGKLIAKVWTSPIEGDIDPSQEEWCTVPDDVRDGDAVDSGTVGTVRTEPFREGVKRLTLVRPVENAPATMRLAIKRKDGTTVRTLGAKAVLLEGTKFRKVSQHFDPNSYKQLQDPAANLNYANDRPPLNTLTSSLTGAGALLGPPATATQLPPQTTKKLKYQWAAELVEDPSAVWSRTQQSELPPALKKKSKKQPPPPKPVGSPDLRKTYKSLQEMQTDYLKLVFDPRTSHKTQSPTALEQVEHPGMPGHHTTQGKTDVLMPPPPTTRNHKQREAAKTTATLTSKDQQQFLNIALGKNPNKYLTQTAVTAPAAQPARPLRQLQSHGDQVAGLKDDLIKLQLKADQAAKSLSEQLAKSGQQLADLEQANQQLTQDNKAAATELLKAEQEREASAQHVRALEQERGMLDHRVRDLMQTGTEGQQAIEALEGRLAMAEQNAQALQVSLATLTAERDELRDMLAGALAELESARAQVVQLEATVRDEQAATATHKRKAEAMEGERVEAEHANKRLRQDLSQLSQFGQHQQQTAVFWQQQTYAQHHRADRAEAMLAASQAQNQQLQQQLAFFRSLPPSQGTPVQGAAANGGPTPFGFPPRPRHGSDAMQLDDAYDPNEPTY